MTSSRIPKRVRRALAACLLLILAGASPGYAQVADPADADEPLLDRLTRTFKHEYLSLGVVVQAVGGFKLDRPPEDPGTDGFSLATARLSLRGTLDYGFGYVLQTDFTRNPAILDARLSYAFSPALTLDAGLFKAPFSAEFLIPAPSIDFVNRAQVVSTFAPNRQVGAAVRGTVGGVFGYNAGVFNGNGRQPAGNDDNKLLYAGRVSVTPRIADVYLEVGGNVAFSEDDRPGFSGTRSLVGGDVRLEWDRWLLSGEAIFADLSPDVGVDRQPYGYHATLGYMIVPDRHQLLARWDALSLDDGTDDRNVVILGYNFWPSRAFEVQVNYLIPTREGADVGDHEVLVNFQVAF